MNGKKLWCLISISSYSMIVSNNTPMIKRILRGLLRQTEVPINHWDEIKKLGTIKDAHLYCVVNKLSGQEFGHLIERFIIEKFHMRRNSAVMCRGDATHRNHNVEIKVSCGGKTFDKFNYVQIRMNHDCHYLLTAYYLHESVIDDLGELFIFRLNKLQMRGLLFRFPSYAHGSVKKLGRITLAELNKSTNSKEYALRPRYGGKCWRALMKYRVNEWEI